MRAKVFQIAVLILAIVIVQVVFHAVRTYVSGTLVVAFSVLLLVAVVAVIMQNQRRQRTLRKPFESGVPIPGAKRLPE